MWAKLFTKFPYIHCVGVWGERWDKVKVSLDTARTWSLYFSNQHGCQAQKALYGSWSRGWHAQCSWSKKASLMVQPHLKACLRFTSSSLFGAWKAAMTASCGHQMVVNSIFQRCLQFFSASGKPVCPKQHLTLLLQHPRWQTGWLKCCCCCHQAR